MRGFWRGYYAGRAAPLGAAGAAVVTASFYTFAPAFVARAIPAVWELITPEQALRARMSGAVGHKRVSKDFIESYLLVMWGVRIMTRMG